MRSPMPSAGESSRSVPALFVTATGTGIGKTFVCAGLIRHLRGASRSVRALKPVVSGFDTTCVPASDTGILLDALGWPLSAETIAQISPWRYSAPLSPNMAARLEDTSIDFDALVAFCNRQVAQAHEGMLVIEGIGGLMVPLDERHTVLDWLERLRVPILLVTGSYLGAISHTLTCVEVLRARRLPLAAVLVNESREGVALAQTIETIAPFVDPIEVIALPQAASGAELEVIYQRIIAISSSVTIHST